MKIVSEKEVTVDDVVKIGDAVWKRCKTLSKRHKEEYDAAERIKDREARIKAQMEVDEEIFKVISKEFPEFATSYSIVIRHSLGLKRYESKALRDYVMHIKDKPWTTEDEYLRAQAYYSVCLYKATNHPWNPAVADATFKFAYDVLKDNHVKFKARAEECAKQVSEFEAAVRRRREAAVRAWLAQQPKPAASLAVVNPLAEGMRAWISDKPAAPAPATPVGFVKAPRVDAPLNSNV